MTVAALDIGADFLIIKGYFRRQSVAVLCVPAGVTGRVHDSLGAALRFALGVLAVAVFDNVGLVIGKQYAVRPFLDHACRAAFLAVLELHFVTVIGSHFVRLLKFSQRTVGGHNHVDSCLYHVGELVHELSHFFIGVTVARAVAGGFNGLPLICCTHRIVAQLFRPVDGIQYQRPARLVLNDIIDLREQHRPARGSVKALYVKKFGTALRVDEDRIREARGKGGLADALHAVDHDLLRRVNLSACDVH